MTDLNQAGLAYARSLIAGGKVDKTSQWDWNDARDGDALLGASGNDWTTYGKAHLGIDRSAADKTKARWKYPFVKGGKVFRSALTAIRQRAGQLGDTAILGAAGELLSKIDGGPKKGADADAFELKSAPFEFEFKVGAGEPEGTFEGYASTFNTEDDGGDMVMPGAFDRTLAQSKATGRMPKMLLNHGGGSFFGSGAPDDMLPIGKWSSMEPDDHGLAVKGKLINLDTDLGKRVYGAMKEGELSDLSIGYIPREVVRGARENEPRRQIKSADLVEVSPVTFPMNRLATINSVKAAQAFAMRDLREMEDALCDAGLSRRDAKAAISVFRAYAPRDVGDPAQELRDAATSDDLGALAALIRGR